MYSKQIAYLSTLLKSMNFLHVKIIIQNFQVCCALGRPRIPYASTTQTKVSPPASSASKVWNKVVLSTPYYLGYIWMP
jgi:hypothetical protein